jgi:hypothetical protein
MTVPPMANLEALRMVAEHGAPAEVPGVARRVGVIQTPLSTFRIEDYEWNTLSGARMIPLPPARGAPPAAGAAPASGPTRGRLGHSGSPQSRLYGENKKGEHQSYTVLESGNDTAEWIHVRMGPIVQCRYSPAPG